MDLMLGINQFRNATGSLKGLAASVWWGRGARTNGVGWEISATQSGDLGRYVNTVFQSLAVFRLVSFAMGAGLVFALNPSGRTTLVLGSVVILVGMYNVYRILWRFDPAKPVALMQIVSLGVDLWLNVVLIIVSGALDSPFLIYSLSPILTASLLMNMRAAFAVAGASALSVSGVHAAAGLGISDLPWVLSGNYLVLSLLYWAVCFLIVNLPFLANLSWQRRVRSESLALERQRLRRDVHDSVAQTLAFLSLKMRRAEQQAARGRVAINERDVADIGRVVERTYLAVRDYLDGADEEGEGPLASKLPAVAEQWSRDTGLPVKISTTGSEGVLDSNVKFQLLQVAREALANVTKHANPTNVWVDLECTPEGVRIRVRDDGRGFSPDGPRGHGMGIMNERTAMAGATLDINSTPGEGTEVVVAYSRQLQEEEAL